MRSPTPDCRLFPHARGRAALAGNEPKPLSFSNNVMAAISKAGCNLGTCHGNATGKGGFKLSLRGQDDPWDYAAMVLDAQGRRVNPFVPENSLLLLKGTNKIAHEGGKRFDPKSWEYAVLRDWLVQGMPGPSKNDARLTKLEVTPREATLDAKVDHVQITAKATFSDGSVLDVTQQAVYEPLQNERQRMTQMIKAAPEKREALEDLAWSLANAKEFVLRQ